MSTTLVAAALLLAAGCSRWNEPPLGEYRAVLELPGGELPVRMEIAREAQSLVLYLGNGAARMRVSDIALKDRELTAAFPGTANRLRAKLGWRSLKGEVTMTDSNGAQAIPFRAEHHQRHLFFAKSATDNADVSGRWRVTFTDAHGKDDSAIVEFTQAHDEVSGVLQTLAGERRFVAGQVRDDELRLSLFSGAHAILYKSKIDERGDLAGEYWSGLSERGQWRATRDEGVL